MLSALRANLRRTCGRIGSSFNLLVRWLIPVGRGSRCTESQGSGAAGGIGEGAPPPGYARALREVERRHYGKYIVAILLRKPLGQWMSGRELCSRFNHLCRSQRIVDTKGAWCKGFRPYYLLVEVAGRGRGALVECCGAGTSRIDQARFRIRDEFYGPVAAYCVRIGLCSLASSVPRESGDVDAEATPSASDSPVALVDSPGSPQVPLGAESADDAEAVRIFYREMLYREASPEEVRSQLAHNPEHFSRRAMLLIILRSWEYAHVVGPLREVVREIYHAVAQREPTEAETRQHINSARQRCGGDQATVGAIRSGRIWNTLDVRPQDPAVRPGLASVNDVDTVRVLYRGLLYREPTRDELASHLEQDPAGLDRQAVRSTILNGWEREQLVVPLREMVRQAYELVVLREPTETEMHHHLSRARELYRSNEAAVRSIRTGRMRYALDIRPINVELDVTNRCNLRCVMCLHSHPSYYRRRRQDLPLAVFKGVAETVFHLTRGLSLSYGAESLLHPQFEDVLRLSTGYGIPKVYLNTNGLLLTESLVETMAGTRLHQLAVSVDAATPETYAEIRVGGDFAKLVTNLRMVEHVRDRTGSATPHVSLLFVLMRSNIGELPAFVDLAHEVGADSVIATHLSPYKLLDNADQSAAFDKALCNKMVHEADTRARGYGIAFVAPSDFALNGDAPAPDRGVTAERFDLATGAGGEREAACPFPWHFMAIDMQGDVVPCGWWYGQDPMGSVYDDDVLAIWRNERYQTLREELTSGRLRDVCRTCPAAGMGDPNNPYAFLSR